MPCRSDYMEQTRSEHNFQNTAKILVWLCDKADRRLPVTVKNTAGDYYAKDVGQVQVLCSLIKEMRETVWGKGLTAVDNNPNPKSWFDVFTATNFKDPMCRKLMDWVDEHDAEDVRRERAEKQALRKEKEDVVAGLVNQMNDKQLDRFIDILADITGVK